MHLIKLFVAVPIATPADQELIGVIDSLREHVSGVRWVEREQLHLTLKFIGDVDNRDLLEACRLVSSAVANAAPFPLRLGGLGAFPSVQPNGPVKPAKVIWAGVQEGAKQLSELNAELDRSLKALGIPSEHRQYQPHVTLGRSDRSGLAREECLEAFERLGEIETQCDVNRILLMSSFRERGVQRYEPVHTVRLKS
ncbi:MAG: RNA 2',3'-cyclic phosphodiesterase [Planctomycetota bacterium]